MVDEQFKARAYERKMIEPQASDIVKQDDNLKKYLKMLYPLIY